MVLPRRCANPQAAGGSAPPVRKPAGGGWFCPAGAHTSGGGWFCTAGALPSVAKPAVTHDLP